jgi:hypothetical protein
MSLQTIATSARNLTEKAIPAAMDGKKSYIFKEEFVSG